MGLKQGVLGLLALLVVIDFCSASASVRAQAFRPRTMTQQSQLRDQKAPYGAPFQMPQLSAPGQANMPLSIQSKQVLKGPVMELTWKFPTIPEEPAQPDVNFQLQRPTPARSVAAQCLEDLVHVEVKQDLSGTGQLIEPSILSLGGCGVVNVDAAAQVLIYQSKLQDCGSQLVATEDELVYIFTLDYRPPALQSTPIVRTSGATIGIECHYPRSQNVSSNILSPFWLPYTDTKVAENILVFSLKLMTADWMYERPSSVFFLGDVFNIEASVIRYNHLPICVFVDRCVATASPDVNSAPSYSFIENHGCFTDAKYTGSISSFLARVQDKLQFQLEAFRFQQQSIGFLYITCLLKASTDLSAVNEEHKACSFKANGWASSDGSDQVCGCCEMSCGLGAGSVLPPVVPGFQWEGKAQVGPLQVWDGRHNV
ncbi:zona pellucida sperm-binding protein 3a.2 [Myxocyprinus asiaticus]|uniref:zona pellucida sperm-binding protein 3a.2 n=1 Tax=Myxocyprinus asiaticus TaxID=70543 RepID=UPI0022226358|nr:zona pellucida sperm-binding protein 3a.2 [Myxocyprinus asiaticus]